MPKQFFYKPPDIGGGAEETDEELRRRLAMELLARNPSLSQLYPDFGASDATTTPTPVNPPFDVRAATPEEIEQEETARLAWNKAETYSGEYTLGQRATDFSRLMLMGQVGAPVAGPNVLGEAVNLARAASKGAKIVKPAAAWDGLAVAERVALAKKAGLEGVVGSKAWAKLAEAERSSITTSGLLKAESKVVEPSAQAAAKAVVPAFKTGQAARVKLYRGVPEEESFLPQRQDFGQGTYYSPQREVAQTYAGEGGQVTELAASLKNPLVISEDSAMWKKLGKIAKKAGVTTDEQAAVLTNAVKAQGHDSLVVKRASGDVEVVLYNKVKKAKFRKVVEPAEIDLASQGLSKTGAEAPPILGVTPEQPPQPRRPIWSGIGQGPPKQPPPPATPTPPAGFPSGRKPGGIGNIVAGAQVKTPIQQLDDALTPDKKGYSTQEFLRHWYVDWYPLRKLSKETGIPADKLIQVVPGVKAAGEEVIRAQLLPAIRPVSKDIKHLQRYMVASREVDITTLNPHAKLPGGGQGMATALSQINAIERELGPQRFAAIEVAAKRLNELNDEFVLKPLLNSGVIDNKFYTALKADHPHYIPFMRADFNDEFMRAMTKPEASVSSTGIKKMLLEGSDRKLDQPLARFAASFIKTRTTIARNEAAKSIVVALNKSDPSLVKILKASDIEEHSNIVDTISFFHEGKKVTAQVPALWAEIAKGLDKPTADVSIPFMSAFAKPLKAGAVTYNPAFLIINPLRDALSAFFREKLIPLSPDYLRGWVAVARKNALFSEAAESGALMSGIVDTMRNPSAISRAGEQLGSINVLKPTHLLNVIPRLNLLAEEATRVSTYGHLRRLGIGQLEAAVRARDVTVDFAKMGSSMPFFNAMIPFLNASLQGSINVIRTIKDKPAWALTAAAPFAFLTAMSRINNMRFETSKMIPEREYTSSWVIQVGEGTKKDESRFPIYIKIPKGQIGAAITFPGEALFNLNQKTGDRSAAELLVQAGLSAASVASPIPTEWSGIFHPAMEVAAGIATKRDVYQGRDIIPMREQGLPTEKQFGPDTSKMAIALGRLGVSPRMVQWVIESYTAGTGQFWVWAVGAGLEAMGYSPIAFGEDIRGQERTTAETLAGTPVIQRFMGTKAIQEATIGWDALGKTVDVTNRQFLELPEMNRLGVKIGEVGASINKLELTPAQRAEYQQLTSDIVMAELPKILPLVMNLPDEQKRQVIMKQLEVLKGVAGQRYYYKIAGQQKGTTQAAPQGQTSDAGLAGPSYEELRARKNKQGGK